MNDTGSEKQSKQETTSPRDKWSYDQFRSYILEAGRKLPISLKDMPKEITLDREKGDTRPSIGTITDEIWSETAKDPQRNERFRAGIRTTDGGLRFQPMAIGTEYHVSTKSPLKTKILQNPVTLLKYDVNELRLMTIHSHGKQDSPPSSKDFLDIITDQSEKHEVAFVVVTETTKYLLLRSFETPDLPPAQAEAIINTAKLKVDMQQIGKSREDQFKVQLKVMLETCKSQSLALYRTTNGSNTYQRVEI